MDIASYKHCIPIQIRFNDIDRVNHVNNAMYHSYTELGRVHYFNEVLDRTVDWDKKGFVLARMEIDFQKPIYLRDQIFCYTKLQDFGTKSFRLSSLIVKKTDEGLQICASAVGTLVCMDFETGKSMQFPAEWRQLFSDYEHL